MDELEFRRRVLANPFELDDELIRFSKQNTSRQEFIQSAQSFDKNIRNAVDIDIPEDLAVRIILKQTMSQPSPPDQQRKCETKNYKPWYIAGVATVLAIASLAYAIYTVIYHNSLAQHAVAHMLHEPGALDAQQNYTLEEVNAMLSRIGGKIDDLPGKVTYLRYCDFDGEQSVHLVFHSNIGPVTVLFIPSQFSSPLPPLSYQFQHHHIYGHIFNYENMQEVIMSKKTKKLAQQHARLSEHIRW